jgi:hypothetical protein
LRGARRAVGVAIVIAAVGAAVVAGILWSGADEGARCGPGFEARMARCELHHLADGRWECPRPLVVTAHGCDAPDVRVVVPTTTLSVGPSDWEAEGRVPSRSFTVQAFRIDAFEVTRGRWATVTGLGRDDLSALDVPRAASGMTRDEAQAFCRAEHGDLPTEEQWIVAAASGVNPPRRYAWGDTGAVCRRAAWGLAAGPCARGASAPDTVGAHPDGDSPLGLHDLAGNAAEWVLTPSQPAVAVAKGGSWATSIATELRVWARLELPLEGGEGGRRGDAGGGDAGKGGGDRGRGDSRVGLRCAYSL